MFTLVLRHSGTMNQLQRVFRLLNSPSISPYWENVYLLIEPTFHRDLIANMCRSMDREVVVRATPQQNWPSAYNELLTTVKQPWICSLDIAHGVEQLAALPCLAQAVKTYPKRVGFGVGTERWNQLPTIFCWNCSAMKKKGGWPLRKEWPFTEAADHYVWASLPDSEKLRIVTDHQNSWREHTHFWQIQKERWINAFLADISPGQSPYFAGQKDVPPVSVIMSVYNEQDCIPWAIKSVLYQTLPHFELIIVNDGSTDETVKEITAIADSRIKLVSHTFNRGKVHRLNEALALARGELLFELDADDWLGSGALDWAMKAMFSQPSEVAMIYGDRLFWNEDSLGQLTMRHEQKGKKIVSRQQYLQDLIPVGPRVYRRSALEQVGGWPVDAFCRGRLYEDVRIILHLLHDFHVVYVPGMHYHVRMRENSVTHRNQAYFNRWKAWIQQQESKK